MIFREGTAKVRTMRGLLFGAATRKVAESILWTKTGIDVTHVAKAMSVKRESKEHSAAEPQPNHGGTPWGLVKAVCEDSTNTSNPRSSRELS
jgi:hypothetical protein